MQVPRNLDNDKNKSIDGEFNDIISISEIYFVNLF